MPRSLLGKAQTDAGGGGGGGAGASTDLSDSTDLVRKSATGSTVMNSSLVSTVVVPGTGSFLCNSDAAFQAGVIVTGNATCSAILTGNAVHVSDNTHQIQVDDTVGTAGMRVRIPAGESFYFVIDGADILQVSATAATLNGNPLATTADVNTILTSAATQAATLSLVQASPLTLSQLLTCSAGLNVGASQTINLGIGGDILSPSHSLGVIDRLSALEARSPTTWAPDVINVGEFGSGATIEMADANHTNSIQVTAIRTRYGTDGSGNAIYKVELRGRVSRVSTFNTDVDLFTLPVGYRPSQEHNFIAQGHLSDSQIRIDVPTSGTVKVSAGGSTTNSQFVNLSTVSFWTV